MWNIYAHFIADLQVGIIIGFVLQIVIPGPGRAT
jgi:hypothetical protein